MDKTARDELLKKLVDITKSLTDAFGKTAATPAEFQAKIDAIKAAEKKLQEIDAVVTETERLLKDSAKNQEMANELAPSYKNMHAAISSQQAKLKDASKKIGDSRLDKTKVDAAATASTDVLASMQTLTTGFQTHFTDIDKWVEKNQKAHKDATQNTTAKDDAATKDKEEDEEKDKKTKKGLFDGLNVKGTVGGAIGALLFFMLGKMFGNGLIGKLASFGLAIAGFFMGRDFANKRFNGGAGYKTATNKATSATTPDATTDQTTGKTTTPDQTTTPDATVKTDVEKIEITPEMRALYLANRDKTYEVKTADPTDTKTPVNTPRQPNPSPTPALAQ